MRERCGRVKKIIIVYKYLNEMWYVVDDINFGRCITSHINLATRYGSREEAFRIVEEYGTRGVSNRVEVKEVH